MGSDIQSLASSAKVDGSLLNHATGLSSPEILIGRPQSRPGHRSLSHLSLNSGIYSLSGASFVLRSPCLSVSGEY